MNGKDNDSSKLSKTTLISTRVFDHLRKIYEYKDPQRSLMINLPNNLWQLDKTGNGQLHNQAKQQLSNISYHHTCNLLREIREHRELQVH